MSPTLRDFAPAPFLNREGDSHLNTLRPHIVTKSLPPELQREIIEIAVRSNHRDAALRMNLSLVAHHVHIWVDRVFYEVVTLYGQASADNFLKVVDSKPPGFFAAVVKTLLLSGLKAESAVHILSVCTGVQSLAVWNAKPHNGLLLRVSQLPLRRLSMPFGHVATILTTPATPPTWLKSLTHLDSSFMFDVKVSDLERLRQLPRLTHVALFAFKAGPSHAKAVCDSCPQLRVLVILISEDRTLPTAIMEAYHSLDNRIVVAPFPPDPVRDWEVAHFGLPDMWDRVERVVAEQQGV